MDGIWIEDDIIYGITGLLWYIISYPIHINQFHHFSCWNIIVFHHEPPEWLHQNLSHETCAKNSAIRRWSGFCLWTSKPQAMDFPTKSGAFPVLINAS